jgi:hypothetical protein
VNKRRLEVEDVVEATLVDEWTLVDEVGAFVDGEEDTEKSSVGVAIEDSAGGSEAGVAVYSPVNAIV